MMTFIDYAIKGTWIRLVKSKDEALHEFIAFTKIIAIQFNVKIKSWFADGKSEYLKINEYCKKKNIA
jgi:hypothetical protein